MQSFKGKIQHMVFEYSAEWLKSQGCTDLVARVQGLGFQVYKYIEEAPGFLGQKLHSEPNFPLHYAEELLAKSNHFQGGFRVGHGHGHGRGRGH